MMSSSGESKTTEQAAEAARPKSRDDRPSRVALSESDLGTLSASDLAARWRLQDAYINSLEQRLSQQEGRYQKLFIKCISCIRSAVR